MAGCLYNNGNKFQPFNRPTLISVVLCLWLMMSDKEKVTTSLLHKTFYAIHYTAYSKETTW